MATRKKAKGRELGVKTGPNYGSVPHRLHLAADTEEPYVHFIQAGRTSSESQVRLSSVAGRAGLSISQRKAILVDPVTCEAQEVVVVTAKHRN